MYNHIRDCWQSVEESIPRISSLSELENLFEEFPHWAGEWSYSIRTDDSGKFESICVTNDYYDNDTECNDCEVNEYDDWEAFTPELQEELKEYL